MITISQFKRLKFKNSRPNLVDENIGNNIYQVIKQKVDINNKNLLVLCGNSYKGNLGFILARLLKEDSNVAVIFVDKKENLDEDYKINYFKIIGNIKQDHNMIYNYDIIIDAILDNDVKGFVREPMKSAMIKYNNSKSYKIAIDYPSGLNPDNGIVVDIATSNDLILTIHDTKKGLLDYKNVVIVKSGLE